MFPQVMEGVEEGVVLTKSSFTSTPKQKVINVRGIKESKKVLTPTAQWLWVFSRFYNVTKPKRYIPRALIITKISVVFYTEDGLKCAQVPLYLDVALMTQSRRTCTWGQGWRSTQFPLASSKGWKHKLEMSDHLSSIYCVLDTGVGSVGKTASPRCL